MKACNPPRTFNLPSLFCLILAPSEKRLKKQSASVLKTLPNSKKSKPELLIGVLGCMAERLKSKFLEDEKLVDIVVGPDAYRDLPRLVNQAMDGDKAINVFYPGKKLMQI